MIKTPHDFYRALAAANPNPKTELTYTSPFQLLVAVILSAQATDVSVNKATKNLFAIAPDAATMFALGEAGLQPFIQSIGLYRTKAKHVIATCQQLLEKYDGMVPSEQESLEALAGVGRKTANVVLNSAFGKPTIAVDTHIFRVANRTGIAPGKTVRIVEDNLLRITPTEFLKDAHHWLVLHGRYVCKARLPCCKNCVVSSFCGWEGKG